MFNIKLNHGLILVSLAAFTVSCTNSGTKDADKRATPGQENTAKVPGDQTGSQQIQTNVNEPSFTDNRHGEQTNGALGAEPKINSDRKTVSIDSNGVDNKIIMAWSRRSDRT